VREPQVFLFDEPLSNLDATLRVQMRAEIAQLHARLKTTIIYVTHDQSEAMTLGDRIVLMDHGVIQQIDAPLAIYRRPANRFVASFIGSPPMNLLQGQVTGGAFRLDGSTNGEAAPSHDVQVGPSIPTGPALLGVRPEDIIVGDNSHPFANVTLDIVEHLGHETIAHFTLAGVQHALRLPADTHARPDDQLPISIRPGTHHVFSAVDGKRLN
jgi:ABC-type sugar transport system ATPase subunit